MGDRGILPIVGFLAVVLLFYAGAPGEALFAIRFLLFYLAYKR
jgi:hypothetical protein